MSKKQTKKELVVYEGLILLCIGLLVIFGIQRVSMDPYLAMYLSFGGILFMALGLINLTTMLRWPDAAATLHRQRMKHADSGIVWVWAVALCGMVLYALAYYSLVWPTLQLIGIVEGMASFDANATITLTLVRAVLNWHPIIFIFGTLLWAFVNSVRREDVTYPI
jgi:hypothetical protein